MTGDRAVKTPRELDLERLVNIQDELLAAYRLGRRRGLEGTLQTMAELRAKVGETRW